MANEPCGPISAAAAALSLANLSLAAGLWLCFVGGLFIARIVVPGPVRQGRPLRDGTRQRYKLNGIRLMGALAALLAAGHFGGMLSLSLVHKMFWPLFDIANVGTILLTAYLYVSGKHCRRGAREQIAAPAGGGAGGVMAAPRTGAAGAAGALGALPRDVWLGVELNPTLCGVDLKMFAYVPSLLGLWVINLSFVTAA
ncbi:MAG TPA: hypothetical protein VFS43_37805 [Polyangiaceae bacterium]|nr:hypothetical protein [Polyangiaceae bacterium]